MDNSSSLDPLALAHNAPPTACGEHTCIAGVVASKALLHFRHLQTLATHTHYGSRRQKATCRKLVTSEATKRLLTLVMDRCRCQLVMAHGPDTSTFANSQSPPGPWRAAIGSTPVCFA